MKFHRKYFHKFGSFELSYKYKGHKVYFISNTASRFNVIITQ